MDRLASRIMLTWGFRRVLLAILVGALAALALPPISFVAILFVSFPVLVWLLDGATGNPDKGFSRGYRTAFLIGWSFGFGYFVAGLWWLGGALLVEADEFAWALPLAVLGLPAVLAIFYGLATLAAKILWSDGVGRIAALAAAFGTAEWLRGFVATGFPWNAIGYGAMPVPVMMQSAQLIGVYGVSALAVFVFAAPALVGTGKGRRIGLTVALTLALAHFGYGIWVLARPDQQTDETLTVRLVQPAVDQARKMENADREEIFSDLLRLTSAPPPEGGAKPNVIVWPETSVPFILTENPDALTRIADALDDGQTLLAGAVRAEDRGAGLPPRYYNSIYIVDDKGQIIGASDKTHLTPFGEYVPFEGVLREMGVDNLISLPGGFSAGVQRSLLDLPAGGRLYPLICYEVIFPQEMADVSDDAGAILNVTNDAWFGATPGPYQHFQQARVRAVETGLPLIRAANDGISAAVDARGRIISGLKRHSKGAIDTTISLLNVSVQNFSGRQRNFWLIISFLLLVAVVSRLSFISRKN
ncbi:apolipoprotein N-acyltransferase [Ciceribacter sp. L1K22]|uniref:apolipoprotein N-acyltransferase n=1 Tax=Ciceribacter sp. L1K22 TaxID=2820275 RepID=UPI001ABE9C80|nr:apolipoprotein N-acyltransferase [Ciceribacter sp. L1K22]MBO3758816.1 apolipoprotein N-acyltransferase [Ciceribacter sp. L1K22]